jgi:enoyl-CoA hydratase/carnithine racemase
MDVVADFVRVESDALSDGFVRSVRLNRAPVNAISRRVIRELGAVAGALSADPLVRVVVLHGGPKNFSAGLDRLEFASRSAADVDLTDLRQCLDAVARIEVPVVAALTGYVLGAGLELALCADVRVSGDNARFGDAEALRDISVGQRGERLVRHVGPSRAKDLTFSGRHLGAAEALDWGLVDQVVAPDDVYDAAMTLARQYARNPGAALRGAKAALDRTAAPDAEGR